MPESDEQTKSNTMKTIIFYIVLASFGLATQLSQAQTDSTAVETKKEYLQEQREKIIQEEKDKLRAKIERINERLDEGEITKEKAEMLKRGSGTSCLEY